MKLADRLKSALERGAPSERLLPGDSADPPRDPATPAAVLIAVTERERPGVLLTVRRHDLRTHAGQIAFPGGRIDPGEDAVAAALREAKEELDLDPERVQPIAALDPYRTITGYCVTPVLSAVPPDLPICPHDLEVADWFEAPLDHLLDPANRRRRSLVAEGLERHYYEIGWEDRRIWGATAAMLVNLSRLLKWS